MDLYIPKMSDTPAITIPGLADNFNKLNDILDSRAVRIAKAGDAEDVQRLLDELGALGGGTVIMPSGEYKVKKTILIPSNCNLRGVGPSTVLKSDFPIGVVDPLIVSNAGVTTSEGYTAAGNIVMSDFAVDSEANGIGCSHAENVLFERITGISSYWHFFDIAGSRNVTIRDCRVKTRGTNSLLQIDNMSGGGGYMVYDGVTQTNSNVDGTSSCDILVDGCFIDATGANYGIHLHRTGGRDIMIRNTTVVGGTYGMYSDTGTAWSNVTVKGCTFKDQNRGIFLPGSNTRDSNRGLTITDCTVLGVRYQGIAVDYWQDCIVSNLRIQNSVFTEGDANLRCGVSLFGIDGGLVNSVSVLGHTAQAGVGIKIQRESRDVSLCNIIVENALQGIAILQAAQVRFGGVIFNNCETDVQGEPLPWIVSQ